MHKFFFKSTCCFFILLSIYSKTAITIKGSTTLVPLTQILTERCSRNTDNKLTFKVYNGGTGEGIKALINGETDIAAASRDLLREECHALFQKGINTQKITIARDGIAVVVNPTNPISSLKLTQIQQIFQGKIRHWSEINGTDKQIVVVTRTPESGTYHHFIYDILKRTNITKKALRVISNQEMANVISRSSKTIGYLPFEFITSSIKPIKIDGIPFSLETIKNKQYPFVRDLYYFVKEPVPENIRRFLDFIYSPEGIKIIQKQGFIPVKFYDY